MKKQLMIPLSLGILVALAACNSSNNNTPNQAEIDSMVNARVATMEAQQKAQNDSMINAMAKMKADSMMGVQGAAAKTTHAATSKPAFSTGKSTTTGQTTTTTTTTTTTPKSTITPEQKKEQDAKFNER